MNYSATTPDPNVEAPPCIKRVLFGSEPRGAIRVVSNGWDCRVQVKGWFGWKDVETGPYHGGHGRTVMDRQSAYELYNRLVIERQKKNSEWQTVRQWW